MTEKIVRILSPIFLYTMLLLLAASLVVQIPGHTSQDAWVPVGAALAAVPIFLWMMRRENGNDRAGRRVSFFFMALLAGAIFSVLYSLITRNIPAFEQLSNETQEAFYRAPALLQIFGLGFFVPVAEELCYRGLFYRRLREVLPVYAAVPVAAAVFAVGHGNLIQFFYALPAALILNILCEKSGSVWYTIGFHMGANLISVITVLLEKILIA